MRWPQTEYLLKGIYLGLLLFVALHEPDWASLGVVAGLTLGGLALLLGLAAYQKVREGYRPRGRLFSFLLFLVLESPEMAYAGVILGLTAGALLFRKEEHDTVALIACAGGGAALGLVFWLFRSMPNRWVRRGVSLGIAAVLVLGALWWFGQLEGLGLAMPARQPIANATVFGVQILLGVPLFYLLVFAGRQEESEVEIGVLCAALGLGNAVLTRPGTGLHSAGFTVPIILYAWYTTRVMPRVRVFKHSIQGFSYSQIGRHRQAILSFRRALEFDPNNALAREGLWRVHRTMDFSQLGNDPQTLAVVDLDLCLERARSLLLQSSPRSEHLQEANRLLDLVRQQRPAARATVHYWRAVALTHAQRYDEAAAELEQVIDPMGYLPDDAPRRAILYSAWQLAARAHPELIRRVGTPQLGLPGRRLEAIAAVERRLAEDPQDTDAWGFKRLLYQDLTENELAAAGAPGPGAEFDFGYVQQLGLALIGDASRWQRGAEYLRMAAKGLPLAGPSIFTQIAQACLRAGQGTEAWTYYEKAKQAGRAIGTKQLPPEERQAYFTALKILAEAAAAHQRYDRAVENYQLYAEYERSGVETLRTLAELNERRGDPLSALRATDQALLYNAKDPDLLERKDRYYYSVQPEHLQARLDAVRNGFDVAYCLKKSRSLLDAKNWDLDLLDWAQHLAELARIVQPENLTARVLVARALLRRGEKEEAQKLLESVRNPKPERFASGEEEDAWFLASKLLGEMYLQDLGRPDLAVECFRDYRQCSKSGADTVYKLAQAYEQLGDASRAVKFYKYVTSYEGHPLAPDAHSALYRLQAK